MPHLASTQWWKDPAGWKGKGVRHFFDESKRYYLADDLATAIEILEWGKRYSLEEGSGGAASHFDIMITKLRDS